MQPCSENLGPQKQETSTLGSTPISKEQQSEAIERAEETGELKIQSLTYKVTMIHIGHKLRVLLKDSMQKYFFKKSETLSENRSKL